MGGDERRCCFLLEEITYKGEKPTVSSAVIRGCEGGDSVAD